MGTQKINKTIRSLINFPKLPDKVKQKLEGLDKDIDQLINKEKVSSSLVNIDGLTGLYNHKHFHEVLSQELSRSARFQHSLSLVMIDIDHFKRFNDTYGHPQGDIILKEMADIIKSEIRTYDTVFRYGGEEFSIIMPHTLRRDAYQFIERLRIKIAGNAFYGKRGNKKEKCRITISAGIAVFPMNARTKSVLINRSDKALYMAKEEGRNRVCSTSITGSTQIRFGFCPPSLSPFYSDVLRGIRDVADEVGNVGILIFASGSDSDYKEQFNLMKKAVNHKLDAVGICSKINVRDLVVNANKLGVSVFVFNVRMLEMTAKGKITSYIGYVQEDAGKKVGQFLAKVLRYRGKVAVLEGLSDEIDSIERKKGFIEALKDYPAVEVVASESGSWRRSESKKVAAGLLVKNPDLDAFFGLSDEMALGAVDAVKEAGRNGEIFTIGLDGNQNALRSIKRGELFATLSTSPFEMGRILMRTVIRNTIKEEVINIKTESPIVIVDAENVDQYLF